MDTGTAFTLVGTGLALGVVHVLTGPDHMSALATLSANAEAGQAFFLGVRWGIGHSTGLLLIAIIFIILTLNKSDDTIEIPEKISHAFESLVGIFMLFLGVYGLQKAWDIRSKSDSLKEDQMECTDDVEAVGLRTFTSGSGQIHTTSDNREIASILDHGESVTPIPAAPEKQESTHSHFGISMHSIATYDSVAEADRRTHPEVSAENAEVAGTISSGVEIEQVSETTWLSRFMSRISTRTLAVLAGIIHGLAGPGGVLGVIPAVQLHNGYKAAVYLVSFCFTSTLTMGVFAVLYGSLSKRLGNNTARREFIIQAVSASLSLLVGILWLSLLACGKMDQVFP